MPKTLSASFELNVRSTQTNEDVGAVSKRNVPDRPKVTISKSLTNGTGADQASKHYQVQGTIAGSANADIDLAGVLLDAFGEAITFARIKTLIIENLSASPNQDAHLDVKAAASNGWAGFLTGTTPALRVRAGGAFALYAPDATAYDGITGGSADTLQLTNVHASQTCTYRVTVIGA